MVDTLASIVAITSTLFRVFVYIFLRVIPSSLIKTILPYLYIVYLSSTWFYRPPAEDQLSTVDNKSSSQEANGAPDAEIPKASKSPSVLTQLIFSVPSRRRLQRLNFVINTVLLLAAVELVLFPVYDNASNVVFTRVGAIYPDAAKVTVRYPLPNETEHDVRLVWRQANNDEALPWVDGPSFHLTAEHDWVRTERLGGLWPDTTYEYTLRSSMGELLPYPAEGIRFKTFPDPRLQSTSHFRFIVTSCATPNFPYLPFHGRRIKGFDLLADYLWPLPSRDSSHVEPPSSDNNDTTDTSQGTPSDVASTLSTPSTEFMLFLGDFIYADVPMFFGDDKEAFRRLYRRNYQSESFRKVYERLPIFHTYDDHEIINNFAGQGVDSPPYVNASQAYALYNADANYDSQDGNQSYYYDFRYADVAFFVMDTRRYRSRADHEDISSRTMLGDDQLASLYKWLAEVNNTATFKFIVTSVPFTSLWQHDARWDSWAAYPAEKMGLLSAMHSVPNVVILSGDRHEFAAMKFTSELTDNNVVEISTSPLSMFYVPLFRTLRMQSEHKVVHHQKGGTPEEIPQEQVLKYLPLGNYKWSSIEVDTRDREHPIARLEVMIDGSPAYRLNISGKPVNLRSSTAVGAFVSSNLKDILDKIGLKPQQWF